MIRIVLILAVVLSTLLSQCDIPVKGALDYIITENNIEQKGW